MRKKKNPMALAKRPEGSHLPQRIRKLLIGFVNGPEEKRLSATIQLGLADMEWKNQVRERQFEETLRALINLVKQGLLNQIPYQIDAVKRLVFIEFIERAGLKAIEIEEIAKGSGGPVEFEAAHHWVEVSKYEREIPLWVYDVLIQIELAKSFFAFGGSLVEWVAIVEPTTVVFHDTPILLVVKSGGRQFKVADWPAYPS